MTTAIIAIVAATFMNIVAMTISTMTLRITTFSTTIKSDTQYDS
jgi:hypothetical protein